MLLKNICGVENSNKSTPIYALCDYEILQKKSLSIDDFLKIATKKRVSLVQYRDKVNSIEIQKINLLKLIPLDIPIIINDNLELLEFANGLHLGQEDIQYLQDKMKLKDKSILFKLLKKRYPDKIFGISTHNEFEILEANTLDIDYIGLGAYKVTNTKNVSTILGEKISYLAKISKHPVCAIGGVKCDDKIENINFNVIGNGLFDD